MGKANCVSCENIKAILFDMPFSYAEKTIENRIHILAENRRMNTVCESMCGYSCLLVCFIFFDEAY